MKYRKKPVVVEAMQYTVDNIQDIFNWADKEGDPPVMYQNIDGFFIETLEGKHLVSDGDLIIMGVAGEFYPCKPDIFEKTYEKVD